MVELISSFGGDDGFKAIELSAFEEVEAPAKLNFTDKERELAQKLIEQLSSEKFEAEKYRDTYSDKVREAVEQKVAGQEITVAPEAPKAQIIDLFDALKKSLANAPAPPPSVAKPPKKKSRRGTRGGRKRRKTPANGQPASGGSEESAAAPAEAVAVVEAPEAEEYVPMSEWIEDFDRRR